MTLTEFKRFAAENNIVPVSTEIYSQMISDSVKYAKMKEVLQEIGQEIEDIKTAWQERIWLFTTNDCFDRVLEIIDKHIKEIEGSDKE